MPEQTSAGSGSFLQYLAGNLRRNGRSPVRVYTGFVIAWALFFLFWTVLPPFPGLTHNGMAVLGQRGHAHGHHRYLHPHAAAHHPGHPLAGRQTAHVHHLRRVHQPRHLAVPVRLPGGGRHAAGGPGQAHRPGHPCPAQGLQCGPRHLGHVLREHRAGLPGARGQRPRRHPAARGAGHLRKNAPPRRPSSSSPWSTAP